MNRQTAAAAGWIDVDGEPGSPYEMYISSRIRQTTTEMQLRGWRWRWVGIGEGRVLRLVINISFIASIEFQ